MDCIAQIVNSSKLCVNFSRRIRMDSIQSQCSAIWTLFKSHVIKLFLILLWTQISNFGHFGHFDFGHKSTQNPGAMPQLWHLTLATCPRICGTINSTKMTVDLRRVRDYCRVVVFWFSDQKLRWRDAIRLVNGCARPGCGRPPGSDHPAPPSHLLGCLISPAERPGRPRHLRTRPSRGGTSG